jgi:Na+-transporting methylmalonyl-CoA/oxaloacetate decarboxylase gamma subunit
MIEFVFLGILVLVPLLYLVVAVSTVERNVFAVTEAAREAGRAYATADDEGSAVVRAAYAARLALQDQRIDGDATLRYVSAAAPCNAPAVGASLSPGRVFAVCVTRTLTVPGVPGFLDARRNTVTGRFVVHVDDFRRPG